MKNTRSNTWLAVLAFSLAFWGVVSLIML
ncbi:hypothetical protein HWC07_gp086 [Pantoea phage vB_PagM_LIET2]|uniref:Uncharacterized protein n=1 Tax=Pantoea phage vB_PagM_LIET2 TaxID=2508071 RepID=A0A411AW73_9CAUD|nr:hypothetical protein HWC07_gp086 [Pantoea phage vB_PagM_LIET2]QAX92338.1 hypothetical protein LIET2_gp086 [Pantoea phage vB_PagM_LIET2]